MATTTETPSAGQSRDRRVRPMALLAAIIGVGTLVRVVLAAATEGTNDVDSWLAFVDAARSNGGFGLYKIEAWPTVPTFRFNHGPLIALGLQAAGWLIDILPLGGRFLVRVPAIAADALAAALVYLLVVERQGHRAAFVGAGLVALNPVLILVSGLHGNTDPVFGAAVLGVVYLIRKQRSGAAGVVFALACGVKVVPLILAPVFVLWLATRSDRWRFAGTAAAISVVLWLPALLVAGAQVYEQIFGYRGLLGLWGLGQMVYGVSGYVASGLVLDLWTYTVFVALLVAAYRMWRSGSFALERAGAAVLLFFLALTPGFGVQYLVWPVLLLTVAAPRLSVAYSAVAGLSLYVVYAWWSGGGWALGYANAWDVTELWSDPARLLVQATWVTVVVVSYLVVARLDPERTTNVPSPTPASLPPRP